jgi:radical SAM protein (TIGR01212 family)
MVKLTDHYRTKFGCKVYKLSIDAGFTCPSRDGTLGTGGCIFCGADGGSAFAEGGNRIRQQLEQAKSRVAFKGGEKFIAYFQSFTGTYAPIDTLRRLYEEAMAPEDVVGLAIGTRPDCLSDAVIDLLAELNRRKPISVELGLQTTCISSVQYIRRGYDNEVYFDAVKRLKAAGLDVVTHIILGLPGETPDMMLKTVQYLNH